MDNTHMNFLPQRVKDYLASDEMEMVQLGYELSKEYDEIYVQYINPEFIIHEDRVIRKWMTMDNHPYGIIKIQYNPAFDGPSK